MGRVPRGRKSCWISFVWVFYNKIGQRLRNHSLRLADSLGCHRLSRRRAICSTNAPKTDPGRRSRSVPYDAPSSGSMMSPSVHLWLSSDTEHLLTSSPVNVTARQCPSLSSAVNYTEISLLPCSHDQLLDCHGQASLYPSHHEEATVSCLVCIYLSSGLG